MAFSLYPYTQLTVDFNSELTILPLGAPAITRCCQGYFRFCLLLAQCNDLNGHKYDKMQETTAGLFQSLHNYGSQCNDHNRHRWDKIEALAGGLFSGVQIFWTCVSTLIAPVKTKPKKSWQGCLSNSPFFLNIFIWFLYSAALYAPALLQRTLLADGACGGYMSSKMFFRPLSGCASMFSVDLCRACHRKVSR